MNRIHILPDPILRKKTAYVCGRMRLHVVQELKDEVGTYAYTLRDDQGRKYLFACKRYIDWSPKDYGRVSFTKSLVDIAKKHGWTLLMLIEEKEDDELSRNYIYLYNPGDIYSHPDTYPNKFNGQNMINFNIEIAINCEIARRREILDARVNLKKSVTGKEQNKMNLTLTRFVK